MTPRLGRAALTAELRETIDAAMILSPDIRRNRSAFRRLRLLLAAYPDTLHRMGLLHNIGKRRLNWLAEISEGWE